MLQRTVGARAAIAGNPSDGYGGAVFSTMVPGFQATASARDTGQSIELVEVARQRFAAEFDVDLSDLPVTIETDIPRSVGLAGSSAIVIATLELCADSAGITCPPMQIAGLAHTVERVDLGIAGGWQDQLVQSHQVTALMEFAEPKRLDHVLVTADRDIPMYLAFSTEAAEPSGDSHRSLQSRRSDPDVLRIMEALAECARQAAAAATAGDVHTLKASINTTYDLRQQVMDIAPAHAAMVAAAHELGASANFAGSGGAIIGVLPKSGQAFLDAMQAAGYDTSTWSLQ